jgi:hypothetical protein
VTQPSCDHDRLVCPAILWAEAEIKELRADVIAFCAPWAATYARDHGFPDRHLHPTHYDILARCGARMDAFIRGEETPTYLRQTT